MRGSTTPQRAIPSIGNRANPVLTRLYIANFVLIEAAEIEFGPGLNVLTGETGAGKSIIVSAIGSVLGAAANTDLVRQGCDRATVECLFEFDLDEPDTDRLVRRLDELELAVEDGQVALRREIQAAGRSRAFVNGMLVPIRTLRQVGAALLDLHGQHEHQSLLDAGRHATFLNAFAGLAAVAERVADLHGEHAAELRTHQTLVAERDALQQESELRRFQLEEINACAPQPDEEEELENNVRVLENIEDLTATAGALYDILYQADASVVSQLAQARRQFERLVGTDASLGPEQEAIDALVYGAQDLADAVRSYLQRLEPEPTRLEELRNRAESLRRLKSKYGGTLEAVIAHSQRLEEESDRSAGLEADVERAATAAEACRGAYAKACRELSAGRQGAAETLAAEVETNLGQIGMAAATFEVRLRRNEEESGLVEADGGRWRADGDGMESVEFLLAANAGETPLPLKRVASGGEISRIMLVLKELIAERDEIATLVFDEIDSGISGRIAAAVGRKLEALSASHQLIVITHLPQIASLAHRHFDVSKQVVGDRTVTAVRMLEGPQRREQIARLLAGETVSDTARRHAAEMMR